MNIIKTNRLALRPIKRGDEPFFVNHMNHKKLSRGLLAPPYPYTMRDARKWVNENIKSNRKKKNRMFYAFIIETDGKSVGCAGVHNVSGHKCELGYWVGVPFWGNGIATEAAKALVRFGFKELGLKRIQAAVYPWNKASIRVLKKCGFKKEGYMRKAFKKWGKYLDAYLFAVVR